MSIRANTLLIEDEEEQLGKLSRHVYALNRHTQMLKNMESIRGSQQSLPQGHEFRDRRVKYTSDKIDHHTRKITKHWGVIQRIKGNRENWTRKELDVMNIANMGSNIAYDFIEKHPSHSDELRAYRSYTS